MKVLFPRRRLGNLVRRKFQALASPGGNTIGAIRQREIVGILEKNAALVQSLLGNHLQTFVSAPVSSSPAALRLSSAESKRITREVTAAIRRGDRYGAIRIANEVRHLHRFDDVIKVANFLSKKDLSTFWVLAQGVRASSTFDQAFQILEMASKERFLEIQSHALKKAEGLARSSVDVERLLIYRRP